MPKFYFTGDPTFGANRIGTQIKNAVKKNAQKAEKLLKQPTATWNHGVSFTTTIKGDVTEVTTGDEPYAYLDDGTAAHPIFGNPYLSFQENFTPKTAVGSLNSVHGGKSGAYVSPKPEMVNHPGNEARDFTGQVIKIVEPAFQQDIENEIAKSIV